MMPLYDGICHEFQKYIVKIINQSILIVVGSQRTKFSYEKLFQIIFGRFYDSRIKCRNISFIQKIKNNLKSCRCNIATLGQSRNKH